MSEIEVLNPELCGVCGRHDRTAYPVIINPEDNSPERITDSDEWPNDPLDVIYWECDICWGGVQGMATPPEDYVVNHPLANLANRTPPIFDQPVNGSLVDLGSYSGHSPRITQTKRRNHHNFQRPAPPPELNPQELELWTADWDAAEFLDRTRMGDDEGDC